MTLLTGRQSLLGLIKMLNSDDARTWQEVFVSGDASSSGVKCVGSILHGTMVSLVFVDALECRHYVTISDDIALGFPIASVFSPGAGTYWQDELAANSRVHKHVEALDLHDHAVAARLVTAEEASPRILVRGNANFAHVLLSVCPAVERLIDMAAHVGTRLPAAALKERHPLGTPAEIYPELGEVVDLDAISEDTGSGLRYVQDSLVPAAVGVSNKKPLMAVTDAARTRLRGFIPGDAALPSGLSERIAGGDHDFVLWMSIRMLARRTIPLVEAIDLAARVAAQLETRYERPAIILDGLSLQSGDTLQSRVSGFSVEQHLDAERLAASLISARVAKVAPGLRLYAAIGLPLWESIRLAEQADAYIVHDGTTQHKIGWLYPEKPGMVHGPRQRNVGQGYVWHPVDIGTPAIYVPPECVVDHKESGARIPHANYGYSLMQDDRLESFIAAFLGVTGEDDPNGTLYRQEYEGKV
ncbi:hypothetical protein [Arthrobacter koreensis]|uniref:hypothetical protein n=1 Tax=Arthrobacter koreensis TaxID=199136 RepID=UPI002DB6A07D|nr:hypothetical protein [Arthrobacter koreensis]MEB7505062.1 hypothetical protein [Arthrobacter koreensis]